MQAAGALPYNYGSPERPPPPRPQYHSPTGVPMHPMGMMSPPRRPPFPHPPFPQPPHHHPPHHHHHHGGPPPGAPYYHKY